MSQNTAWTDAAQAVANLREARVLTPGRLVDLPTSRPASLIRLAAYYNITIKRLQSLLAFLRSRHGLNLSRMFARRPSRLRHELLGISGIGPETADAILLYAGNVPSLVEDA